MAAWFLPKCTWCKYVTISANFHYQINPEGGPRTGCWKISCLQFLKGQLHIFVKGPPILTCMGSDAAKSITKENIPYRTRTVLITSLIDMS